MKIPLYHVDAFTGRLFGGNPAAVCPLDSWLDDELLQAIASENNLSETAYFVPAGAFGAALDASAVLIDLPPHPIVASLPERIAPPSRSVANRGAQDG